MADRQTQLLEEILAEQKAISQEQTQTNQRLDTLEQDVKSVTHGQETLQAGVGNLKQDVRGLKQDVKDVKHGQESLEQGQGALSVALQKHATTTEEKLEDLQKTLTGFMSDAYDLHDKRITTLEEEVGIKPRKH